MSEYIIKETGYPGAIEQEVVQELIRCRDCKHWCKEKDNGDYGNCKRYEHYARADCYCSDGERREK